MFVGAILGAFFCAGVFSEKTAGTAVLFGLVCGLLFGQLRKVKARLKKLEAELKKLADSRASASEALIGTAREGAATAPLASEPQAAVTTAPPAVATDVAPLAPFPAQPQPTAPAAIPEAAMSSTVAAAAVAASLAASPGGPPSLADGARLDVAAERAAPPAPAVPRMAPPDNVVVAWLKRWFSEGNVPVKVGVIVLFLGVAALLKYAADQGWLYVRIEFRLAGIAAAALAGLVFAWRKRDSHRNFALSLQGGAIGVLILTVFTAFKLYNLLPAGFAFALLVVIVAGAAMLAVLQDAIALAVLAIVGGFLAPILISTGSGNHVALFGYYAVLNAAVFGIAWIRPWRVLNLIGFAFTFGVGTFWGSLSYRPELFASTEPFLLLFFAFYLLIPVLYALRQAPDRRDLIDGTLVFGTPLIAFALQVALVEHARMPLAFTAVGAAAIYTALAALELRRWNLTLLGQSHALLALGFATLAVPLALSARSTSSTWALEGAALVWLGLRQSRRLPQWIGFALQGGAAFAYLIAYADHHPQQVILNGEFFSALLIALSALATARLLSLARMRELNIVFFVWGWLWLWFAWGDEIGRFAPDTLQADLSLVLIAATAVLAAELLRRWDWRECAWPAIAMFPLALPFVGFTADENHGPLEHWAIAAWVVWLVAALRALAVFTERKERLLAIVHSVFLWAVALLLATEFGHFVWRHLALVDIWVALASLLPFAALFWLALQRNRIATWPSPDAAETARRWLLAGVAAVLGICWLFGLVDPGDPAPLPYVPLLNPLELAQLGYLFLLLAWFRIAAREGGALVDGELRARALALAGVVLLTSITLRGAHFLGGVPWSDALWESPLAQAALSITWTVAGIAAMLLGKRRGSRAVWLGGAVLMAVVLVKLLLIDRRFMHDLPAIVGVLVVGVLLVAVGYFAPVPPRTALAGERT
jgi:uncharacterized membrane protein